MESTLVKVDKVTKAFKQGLQEVIALSEVCLDFKAGEFSCISGPSGSGKTTLLSLIGGLDLPSGGEVYLSGQATSKLSRAELSDFRLFNIGFVFQAYNLVPVFSAIENVEFVMQLQGKSPKERRERAQEVLEAVGLEGLEDRRPGQLSGGQQQRVAVARAIASHPELVLADEPTANLDSQTAFNLIDLMHSLNKEKGITFIFSTHDPKIMQAATRNIVLEDGKVKSDSTKVS